MATRKNFSLSTRSHGAWKAEGAMGLFHVLLLSGVVITVLLSAAGCGGNFYMVPNDSYVITGRNYTYAIYNSEHRLMTHPLEDLLAQMKHRQKAGEPQITDIYVVSHGWNYTPDTAVANYHNYIELIDFCFVKSREKDRKSDELKKKEQCKAFKEGYQPYFIFITWISTTRPTAELASAVLPFDLDGAIRPVTYAVDNIPLHLVTAWKQSLNAAANALGNSYPQTYVPKPVWWPECTKKYWTDAFYVEDKLMGQDLPVASLLFELIWAKQGLLLDKRDQSRLLTCFQDQKEGKPVAEPLKNVRIHLVGHSYGAKLVAFAGMEALRRLVLRHKLGHTDDEIDPRFEGADKEQERLRNRHLTEIKYEERLESILRETGHKGYGAPIITSGIYSPDESEATKAVNAFYVKLMKEPGASLIESLIMINPAMHPGEFWYPVDGLHKAPASTLRLIPRKAIVYSKYDYANGTLFNIRELIINTQIAQDFHSAQAQLSNRSAHWYFPLNALSDIFLGSIYGVMSLANSVVAGSLLYVGTTIINAPYDLYYHVTENDFGGKLPWTKKSGVLGGLSKGAMGALNFVDYFVPTYPLSLGFLDRDEDQQGLYRLARPGLGKTGLEKIAAGRPKGINLWGLSGFYEASDDIPPENFCKFAGRIRSDSSDVDAEATRQKLYSFDASLVYDSKFTPDGAHGDVRSREAASCTKSCEKPVPLEKQKRTYSFRFVYNFTKTDFVSFLSNPDGQSHAAVGADSPK